MQVEAAKHEAPGEAGGANKKARTQEHTKDHPPGAQLWKEVECGGEGDCAFCVVARALTAATGKPSPKPEEMLPKGKRVAFLRGQTSKEIRTHAETYAEKLEEAEELAATADKAGEMTTTSVMAALAAASRRDLAVWSWQDNLSRWQSFVIKGREKPQIRSPSG